MKIRTDIFVDVEDSSGLNDEEISLLMLMPLIQTAWVCSAVSPLEKQAIFESARKESIDARHEFNDVIDEWLKYQPSQEFFESCLDLINDLLSQMTKKERNSVKSRILRRCDQVAKAAGGKSLMDINHKISPKEKHLLIRLNEVLL